ncbi:hypothetical protein LS482_04060 [Sinomicrobium kalidii]|uniref:hypothetical protein n=1 Tax=Sinomicrobium kalidii TaxID=2900738 RepID=UPI001E4DEE75|nr:hypothetical protein [Sinomicrobium kalidii]UGU17051.1 hypothetical protein LS482_04060 [Sinomicrobium kalidii]
MITFLGVLLSLLLINVFLLTFSINKTEKKTNKPFRFYPENPEKKLTASFSIKNYKEAV